MLNIRSSFIHFSEFPNSADMGLDKNSFLRLFKEKNTIITAKSFYNDYDRHWGALSIKFAHNGIENYRTENTKYAVTDNNFLILNQDTYYASNIRSHDSVESFTVSFTPSFIDDILTAYNPNIDALFKEKAYANKNTIRFVERTYPKTDSLRGIIKKMNFTLHEYSLNAERVDELLYELFREMLFVHGEIVHRIQGIDKIKQSTRIELFKRLEFARDFIESSYAESICLPQIANIACMNTEYFIRQFKNQYGCSPIQYLTQKRMTMAQLLLKSRIFTVHEVCHKVGYKDSSTFGKLFRRYFNSTPKSYAV
jgi:AraC family transcriptional regulator